MTAPPAMLGRYQIVRRLSTSMSDVYLALDTVGNRRVALKLVATGGDAANRMVLEAERRGAAIQKELHEVDARVVEIYEFGELEGYFFIAMEYLEGRNLGEALAAGAIDPQRAAAIALEICEQLVKFHSWRSTVVHGDIKPSNIHLGPHDTVRLLDFGIAKLLRPDASGTNHEFGSLSYCSPERLTRSQVDQQSDLWAVGATLYEMLAGAPPYRAEDTRKLEKLIRSRRPPHALSSRCPRALREIVNKSLAPHPAERYRSAREFQEDLQAFLERRPTLAEMERRPKWSPNATIDAARVCLRKATRTVAGARRRLEPLRLAGAVAWFAAGMVLWIGGSYAWQQWEDRRVAQAAVVSAAAAPAPAPAPAPLPLGAMYVEAADAVLNAYRTSSSPSLEDFDWPKAEVCLERAAQLNGDQATAGKLALARGYAALERLSGGQYSDAAAPRIRVFARDQFAAAARHMPGSPDPRLALARVYVYDLPNVEQAMEEFAAAERLGAALGPREIEQQGDAYRLRAERQKSMVDVRMARSYYQRIKAFDGANEHLRALERIKAPPRKVRRRR
ncbi:MAG: serine/threonine protein kinase [Acidobacteriia bacterium]|nr:serine/threonine protein kinase [Terriglobia bacterium]